VISMMEPKNRSIDRPSDAILKASVRLLEAKRTGAITNNEFADLIVKIGDLYANKIRQGKAILEEVEEVEDYIECLISKNGNNYFSYAHKGLDVAAKKFLEGDFVALQEIEKRKIQSKPLLDEQDYVKGFKKII